MTTPNTHSSYYVSVEEFIPRANVKYMFQFAVNLENFNPQIREVNFKNLKRTMVWMEKYVVPTMEFWGWPDEKFDIDGKTTLTIQTIGFGWVIAVFSRQPITEKDLRDEEKRLTDIMNRLTDHIPVQAVLRIKASPWNKGELEEVKKVLDVQNHPCEIREASCCFSSPNINIDTKLGELLECSNISHEAARKVESVLGMMKEYANRKYEGAVWCAYQRRRLTLVHKIGSEELDAEDIRFLSHLEYEGVSREIIASRVTAPGLSAVVGFPKAKYHEGNLHPRAIIASNMGRAALIELSTYLYYLWNSHYTKIWLYMQFEDLHAYADNLRTGQYIDPEIEKYWQHLIKSDDIILEMKTHERIDEGSMKSYVPPHDKYEEVELPVAGTSHGVTPLNWLRHHLIDATTTRLTEEPLKRARTLLEEMQSYMKAALNLFVQTRSVRMQQSVNVIQLLFVIGALANVMMVVGPINVKIIEKSPFLMKLLSYVGVQTPIPADSLLPHLANLIILVVLTIIGVLILRRSGVGKWINRILE